MSTKTIFIIRHGETALNRQGIIQGSGVDASLNEFGEQQAHAFYQHYRHLPFEVVLTSNLKRTHETVAPFIQDGLRWEKFADINEISWGIQEGRKGTPKSIQQYHEMIGAWKKGNLDARLEEGESAGELFKRVSRFVEQLRSRPEQLILVCSHGRTMRCLMCALKGQPLYEMENYKHANTGLYKVQYHPPVFQFELENDVEHLQVMGLKHLK